MDEALKPLISHARSAAPFFNNFYSKLPEDVSFGQLPIIDHAAYWKAYEQDSRNVMTSVQVDGVVMKTGGTTSRPKTTAYAQVELQRTTISLGQGLLAGGVRAGDRIANMFYAGDLYGSFLLHTLSIPFLPIPAVHLPIGGLTKVEEACNLIKQCRATVLLSTSTSLVNMASHILSLREQARAVRVVLFGGEPLFEDQEKIIRQAFPCVTSIKSCIYGTVDTGVLAVPAQGSDTQAYQALVETVIIEIWKDGVTVEEDGIAGDLVATNTARQLCPVLRYPTGDRAEWIDRKRGTFRLLGRAGIAIRLGPVSLDMVDVRKIVSHDMQGVPIQAVQAVISRLEGLDRFECVIAADNMTDATIADAAERIRTSLYRERPMLKQHVELKLIAPVSIRFVDNIEKLHLANGSRKVREVVDERF